MALIIAHSVLFGPVMMSDAPWVLEKTYFGSIDRYSGKPVYLFEFAESADKNQITFINALGERTKIAVESAEGILPGTAMFIEAVYDPKEKEIHGRVLYLPTHSGERVELSLIALAWILFYYFVLKKKLGVDWRNLKAVVRDA